MLAAVPAPVMGQDDPGVLTPVQQADEDDATPAAPVAPTTPEPDPDTSEPPRTNPHADIPAPDPHGETGGTPLVNAQSKDREGGAMLLGLLDSLWLPVIVLAFVLIALAFVRFFTSTKTHEDLPQMVAAERLQTRKSIALAEDARDGNRRGAGSIGSLTGPAPVDEWVETERLRQENVKLHQENEYLKKKIEDISFNYQSLYKEVMEYRSQDKAGGEEPIGERNRPAATSGYDLDTRVQKINEFIKGKFNLALAEDLAASVRNTYYQDLQDVGVFCEVGEVRKNYVSFRNATDGKSARGFDVLLVDLGQVSLFFVLPSIDYLSKRPEFLESVSMLESLLGGIYDVETSQELQYSLKRLAIIANANDAAAEMTKGKIEIR